MTIRKTLNVLACAALVLSCTKAGQDPETNRGKLVLKATNPTFTLLSKTTNSGLTPYWSVGDRIGVCQLSDGSNVPFTADITTPSATANFTGAEGQSGSGFAYYPYREGSRSGSVVSLPIAATQYPGASSFDGGSDILVSNSFTIGSGASISFHRLTAVVKLVLRDATTGGAITGCEVERVRLTIDGVNIAGTVAVEGSDGSLGSITSGAAQTIEAVHAEGKRYSVDGTSATWLNLYPATLAANVPVTVEAWLGNMHVVKETVIPSGGLSLRSGYVSTLLVDIDDAHVTCNVPAITLGADRTPVAVPNSTVTVKNQNEFNGIGLASSQSKAGTVVAIKDGTYSDFQVYVNAYGTVDKPLVIRAETLGGVTFTGNSFICINSAYVRLVGFKFASLNNSFPQGRSEHVCLNTGAHHCVVSQCKFDYSSYAGTTPDVSICDIRVFGVQNKVEFCSFLDKKDMGPQVAIHPNDNNPENMRDSVVCCYFTRPTVINDASTGQAANGQESILLGLSRRSQLDQYCYVARNYFYKSYGECSEVISVKGCNNIVEENFFADCNGNLSVRHGKFNHIRRNFLVRGDDSKTIANGICFLDEGNVIEENYLYNLPDNNWYAPILVLSGKYAPERSETDTEILKSYWQTKSCIVRNNVVRHCRWGIYLNLGWASGWRELHPVNCTFSGNIIYDTGYPIYYYVIDGDTQTADGHTWTGNLYSKAGASSWLGKGGFHYDNWGQASKLNKIAYSFPDTEYNAAMSRISSQAGVKW